MRLIRFSYSKNIYYGEINKNQVTFWSDAPWLGGKKLNEFISLRERKKSNFYDN